VRAYSLITNDFSIDRAWVVVGVKCNFATGDESRVLCNQLLVLLFLGFTGDTWFTEIRGLPDIVGGSYRDNSKRESREEIAHHRVIRS
jgi:hypothetical protein